MDVIIPVFLGSTLFTLFLCLITLLYLILIKTLRKYLGIAYRGKVIIIGLLLCFMAGWGLANIFITYYSPDHTYVAYFSILVGSLAWYLITSFLKILYYKRRFKRM